MNSFVARAITSMRMIVTNAIFHLILAEFIHDDETPLFIGYLALEGSGQDGCLNRAACRAPQTARDYLKAAKAVVKGMEMFDNQRFNSSAYAYTFSKFEQSIRDGAEGAPCNAIHQCPI